MRPYREWHPATYVALGRLTGVQGNAKHVRGDTWRFLYVDRTPLGPMIRHVDVFRTEIEVDASAAYRAARRLQEVV